MTGSIAQRLAATLERMASAARAAGRDPGSVRLIAVSKRHSPEAMAQAYAAGQRDFGENYPQELAHKAESLKHLPELRLHMIGHVQRNKARQLVGLVDGIQTVDSAKLARELDKRVAALNPARRERWPDHRLPILIQVNIGKEPQKSGCLPDEVAALAAEMQTLPALQLQGLMCIPPHTDRPEQSRPYFEALAGLRDRCASTAGGWMPLPELSMGMSNDFEEAIAAGATMVRVGTDIFGPRPEAAMAGDQAEPTPRPGATRG